MKIRRHHIVPLLVTLIGAALFLFVFTKAYVSSFTHDESFSYLNYCHESFMEIITYSNWYPNNHVLNSLFMKYSEKLFGNSEWALRLPNLLLLIVFMSYSYLLFRDTDSILAVAMFTLMCTNPLLMDLFGLARGYGMSCGFMVMSLYHFIATLRNHKIIHLALYHLAALLACLSNFTLLTFYLATLIVYNLVALLHARFIREERFRFFRSNKVHILPLLLAGIVLFEPVRRVLSYNTYDFGGKKGFYQDTITHLLYNTFHRIHLSSNLQLVLEIVFTGLVFISLFIIISMIIRKNKHFFEENLGFIIASFVFLLICILIILLHVILGADYPIDRFSIFLFPLFMVHIGFLAQTLISLKLGKVVLTAMAVAALVSLVSFWTKADLYKSLEWAYDSKTKDMIHALSMHHETMHPDTMHPDTRGIKLGIHWHFEPTVNFYRVTKRMDWLLPVESDGFNNDDDYFYIYRDDLHQLDSCGYKIIEEYEDIHTIFLVKTNSNEKR
jgi:hypothetical protein